MTAAAHYLDQIGDSYYFCPACGSLDYGPFGGAAFEGRDEDSSVVVGVCLDCGLIDPEWWSGKDNCTAWFCSLRDTEPCRLPAPLEEVS